jgi:hypothetical protein
MSQSEIEAVRALLRSKPRPVSWAGRRQRLDEVGSFGPVADDVQLDAVDLEGLPGEWPSACGWYMIHAWHLWNAHLQPGRRALASAGAFIRRHLES